MAIATNLKQVRTKRNLQQKDLAVAVGSSRETIVRIEQGQRNASLELALRLSKYPNIPVEDLFQVKE